jgi:hypothetical protein
MLFLKIAFWAALILLLLPTNNREKLEMYGTAYRSMTDVERFCHRNPEICEKTSSIVQTVRAKFRTTTEMIEEMLHSAGIGRTPPADGDALPRIPRREGRAYGTSHATATSSVTRDPPSQNTLTRDDLRPAWNGPGRIAYDSRPR